MEDVFTKYGELRAVTILKDRDTGLPRGIAFVNFLEEGPAAEAISELDGTEFRGRYFKLIMPERNNRPRRQTRQSDEDRYGY